MTTKRRRTSISVEVEIDLNDLSDEDLVAELEARGYQVVSSDKLPPDVEALRAFEAARMGNTHAALEFLANFTGRLI